MKKQKEKQIQVKYKVGVFKKRPMVWMQLPDNTVLTIWNKTITIGYPKKTFKKKFDGVIKNKESEHFLTTWTFDELYVILETLRKIEPKISKLFKNKNKLKGGKNDRTKNHKKTI